MDQAPKANERAWFVFLPNHLREQTIDLSSQGINAQAFSLALALEALTHLRGQKWVIYGGDFYRQGPGRRWRPTYETWYIEHQPSEPIPAFIERSIHAATAAISKRHERLGEDTDTERVVLVVAEPRPNDLARAY
jgi:Immunity protein 40